MNSFDDIQEVCNPVLPETFAKVQRCLEPSSGGEEAAALIDLGHELRERGYLFTTISPASHARVRARALPGKPSLRDIFGWSRSFSPKDLPDCILTCMIKARILAREGRWFRSTVRFSTLGEQLFVHSAFPTKEPDAVFFGPDTYRFTRFAEESLLKVKTPNTGFRILDLGAGSGAGGLHAAQIMTHLQPRVILSDINRRAIFFCKINAELNRTSAVVRVVESDLFQRIAGPFDLIICNPPYLVDPLKRQYRHGGGEFGSSLSLRIAEEGFARLARGGSLLLYTGSPIVDGEDLFRKALTVRFAGLDSRFRYQEIDPDVFGEELEHAPYDRADRIAAVGVTIEKS